MGAALLAAGASLTLAAASASDALLLSLAIAGVLATGLAVLRGASGIDPFEPAVLFVVMWTIMFVIRPVAMIASNDTTFRRPYDITDQIVPALWLALAGAAAFLIGYALPRLLHAGPREDSSPSTSSAPSLPTAALPVAVVAGFIAFASTLANFGKPLEGDTAYLYYLPVLSIPAVLLLMAGAARGRPFLRTASLLLLAVVLANYALVGQRFFVLLAITATAVYLYLRGDRRPRGSTLIIVTIITFFALISFLEVSRGAREDQGESISASALSPTSSWRRFALGGTTEMLPALALQLQTEDVLWSPKPGYLAYTVGTHWIPSAVWADKPLSSAELLYKDLFPRNYASSKANAQFSILGDFYFDSGWPGVIVGMALLGLLCRVTFLAVARRRTALWPSLFYAPAPALFVILLRGDLALVSGIAAFVYTPLVVAWVFARGAKQAPKPLRGLEARKPRRLEGA